MEQTKLSNKLLWGALYASIAMVILGTAVFALFSKASSDAKVLHKISLVGKEVSVTIANTPNLQEKGLGGQADIGPNEGLLFSFAKLGAYGFWMKDMLFPIDVIWFDANRQIVDVWENASPSSYPEIRTPRGNSQYALEVKAGYFRMHNLRIGDQFNFIQ